MRRCNYSELIPDTPEQLIKLEKQQKSGITRDRVRFIRFLKEGTCLTQKESGERIGIKLSQSQAIWRLYREKGLSGLIDRKIKKSWGKLDSHQISRLRERLGSHDLYTQEQIIGWLSVEMGISYTQSGISKLLQRLKIKLKTGRPVNVRKDLSGELSFKKTLPV
jgi:transposase